MRAQGIRPSNIALIKYMGKTDRQQNLPTNSSLSYTLSNLQTKVVIESSSEIQKDTWQPLVEEGWQAPKLTPVGEAKFLKHLQFLKQTFEINEPLIVKSANNFPSDAGLASSASSFAALTESVFQFAKNLNETRWDLNWHDLALLAKKGSGSSCRSFCKPFALWSGESIREIEFPMSELLHQVVLVDVTPKRVSSSEAHARVVSSLLFNGRPARAESRMSSLLESLNSKDWQRSFDLCWAEFWDMHALFETAEPPFSYMKPKSLEVLEFVSDYWSQKKDGPLVTMDAGANVHFLFRPDQEDVLLKFSEHFPSRIVSSTLRR